MATGDYKSTAFCARLTSTPARCALVVHVLPENAKLGLSEVELQAPLLFDPLRDGYLAITAAPDSPAVQSLLQNLLMCALVGLPAGKTQVCVIDPPSLGRDFGWLMHLSDFDPQLVSHRVWTQPGHINKQLSTLAMAAEDFIQQSLRNDYRDIVEYNREAGPLAEPYRLLVWSSLPSGLDDQAWKSLRSLLETGGVWHYFDLADRSAIGMAACRDA